MNVYTTLLTSMPDPQRGIRWPCDPAIVERLARSVERLGHTLVVLHDEEPISEPALGEWVRVEMQHPNVYFARWFAYRDAIAARADPAFGHAAWCVDGSDVELVAGGADFDTHRADGDVFVGSETHLVGTPWLRELHPSVRGWIDANPKRLLLNAGIVGASERVLLWFCDQMRRSANTIDTTDMGVFNRIAWDQVRRVRTGPPVHTVYKAEDVDNTVCWWRHK